MEAIHQILSMRTDTRGILPNADTFADIFRSTCLPNSNARHEELNADFLLVFEQYFCPIPTNFAVNAEFVSHLVSNLKWCNAAGCDVLTVEHIAYTSSDLQFGFKPNSSCSHAILA